MYRNFIRLAAANIKTKLLNVEENTDELLKYLEFAGKNDVDLMVFPELTLTGISSGDFLASREITDRTKKALSKILKKSEKYSTAFIFGLPVNSQRKYFNCLLLVQSGKIVHISGKNNLSFEQARFFDNVKDYSYFKIDEENVSSIYDSSMAIISFDNINIQVIFEDDLINNKVNIHPSTNIALLAGSLATDSYRIVNLKNDLKSVSKLNNIAIAYAGASNYESSSYAVYAAQKYIIENGQILEEGKNFSNGMIISDINIDEVSHPNKSLIENFYNQDITFANKEITLRRSIDKFPYFPKENFDEIMKNILEIQAESLARRLRQLDEKKIFIGISGGLDSTLGIIVASLAYYKLGLDSKDIYAITMPGLGTSDRTKSNAEALAKAYGVTFKEISIVEAVRQHFKDIDHDENDHSITYENAQARERTQILMDLANKEGGIVLGTGNMSEIALGWATYNGDQMSMYNANAGIPKTLLREVVRYVANSTSNEKLAATLKDIVDTPISPELLPTDDQGKIAQKTENSVGPYELHDFFSYHLIKNRSKISDIFYMATLAFADKYSQEDIKHWFSKFLWRLQTQQFKRNAAPDGPQILEYSLSSFNGLVIPADLDPNSLSI